MNDNILTAKARDAAAAVRDGSIRGIPLQPLLLDLADEIERLREQRDKIRAEAKRQFEEWAEHLRACGRQCEAAEARLASMTAALEALISATVEFVTAEAVRGIENEDEEAVNRAVIAARAALAAVEEGAA